MNYRTVWCRSMVRISLLGLLAGAVQLTSRPARASANVGIEGGVVERGTAESETLSPGFGVGSHIEVGPAQFVNFGAYYLQSVNNFSGDSSKDVVFNTLGARTRLVLPLGDIKPYVWAGAGLTWSNYRFPDGTRLAGRFWEIPVGVGVGYRVLELFQVAVEGTYRPSTSFSGFAYEVAHLPTPSNGWSALIALALDI